MQRSSTCNCKQAHAKKEEKFQELQKEQQRFVCSNLKKNQKFIKNKKKRKTEKELQHFQAI